MIGQNAEQIRLVASGIRLRAYRSYLKRWPAGIKTQASFERHVWEYMREFFTSVDPAAAFTFLDDMMEEIDNKYRRAWREGASSLGVDPSEITESDWLQVEIHIRGEQDFLTGVAGDIEQAKIDGLSNSEFHAKFRQRAFMWANRYNAMVDMAKTYYGSRKRFEWVLGPTEKHCHTGDDGRPGVGCADLAGIVLWGEEWEIAGIAPQSDRLVCGGWQCQCRKEETTRRRTPGGLERVMTLLVGANL